MASSPSLLLLYPLETEQKHTLSQSLSSLTLELSKMHQEMDTLIRLATTTTQTTQSIVTMDIDSQTLYCSQMTSSVSILVWLAEYATNCNLATKYRYQRNPRNVCMTLLFAILTENASFRSLILCLPPSSTYLHHLRTIMKHTYYIY